MSGAPTMQISRRTLIHAAVAVASASALGMRPAHADLNRPSTPETDMTARLKGIFKSWDDIAEHRTGTPGDLATADWLADEIRARGATPLLESFTFERRIFRSAFVEVDGERIDGVPLYDGGYTEAPITAELAPLDGETGIGVCDFVPYEAHALTQPMMQARRTATHAAIVAISVAPPPSPAPSLLNAESYQRPYGPPVLQVGMKHRERLMAAAERKLTATFAIEREKQPGLGVNVLTSIPGADPSLTPVIVMTPRSGWWHSTSERGGGIAVWLEAIAALTQNIPERPVYFTANTGHELSHLGMKAYLEDRVDMIKDAHLWVHLGANFAARDVQLRFQASDEDWLALGLEQLAERGIVPPQITPIGTRPFGEARDIYDGNGHYVSLLGTNPLFHHPDDRWPDAVDVQQTKKLTDAMVALIRLAARH
jgi:hypothetical protein